MNTRLRTLLAAALCSVAATPAIASAQTWASWNLPGTCGAPVSGAFGSATVSYTGGFHGVQDATGGAFSCSPNGDPLDFGGYAGVWTFPGSNVVYNPTPDNPSFIQMVNEAPTTNTITFSQAVIDPYIALHSVGNKRQLGVGVAVTYTFYSPFGVVSNNTNVLDPWNDFGEYTLTDNAGAYSIAGREFSGVLQFKGTFTSLSFVTTGSENWHGWTVGAASVVPEPSTFALLGAGLLALGVVARRRRLR